MNTVVYVARVLGDQSAGYHATFPDLPGCTADGASMADLLAAARQAVQADLKRREDQAEEWPEPTSIDRVSQTPGGEGGVLVLVDVQVDDTPVRVNISIGERLLKQIDTAAETRGMTRSGFIASAAKVALGGKDSRGHTTAGVDFEAASRKVQDELSAMGRKISDSLGPDSAFSRNMSELDNRITDAIRKAADNVSAAMARRREAEAQAAAEDAGAKPAAKEPDFGDHGPGEQPYPH